MNNSFLTVTALVASLGISYAQPELTEKGAFDDFSTTLDYSEPSTGKGIYWWGQKGVNTVQRDPDKRQLLVHATQSEYQYVPFGVSFGDDNGDLPGGVPYTIDLSENGKWSFDITNYGKEDLFLRVSCQDNQDRIVDCIPIPNPTNLAFDKLDVWAYQVQLQILAGQTITFKAGTPNDAGKGKLNNCDFANGSWGYYTAWDPVNQTHPGASVRQDCDLTKIKGITFTPMNAAKNKTDFHALALLDGNFGISNFKLGTTSQTLGIQDESVTHDFAIYPNPAKHVVTFKTKVNNGTNHSVQIRNVFGQIVATALGEDEIQVDVSNLNAGIYFVGDQMQKLVIEK